MSALSLVTGGVFLFLVARGEALFAELSSMQPSASSLEWLPKGLSARREAHLPYMDSTAKRFTAHS